MISRFAKGLLAGVCAVLILAVVLLVFGFVGMTYMNYFGISHGAAAMASLATIVPILLGTMNALFPDGL